MIVSKLKEKKPVTIAFLGDSVTQGCFEVYYTREGSLEPEFRPWEAYPRKLGRIFEYFYPDAAVQILNYGVSGSSAKQGLERIDELLSHKPDVVVVCFGLNDCSMEDNGLKEYQEALLEIFERLDGIRTIFMTPNPMAHKISDFITDNRLVETAQEMSDRQNRGVLEQYLDCAKRLCQKKKIKVCDCYREWMRLKEYGIDTVRLLSNGLNHPKEEMHWLFAEKLFWTIIESENG